MITGPILLPARPALKVDKPSMLDFGGSLTASNGGATQRLMRIGTRHALNFTPPPIAAEPLGRIWSAKLRLAKLYGAMLPFGQDGFNAGAPGNPVVDGAGQSGSTLVLRGFTPGYAVRIGQAFNLIRGDRRYLHFVADQQIATGGAATIDIFPMLRIIPGDGAACDFARPMIQGSLSGNEVAWERQTSGFFDFGTLTITEDE